MVYYTNYPIRTCHKTKICDICERLIVTGERYFAGKQNQAHYHCVIKIERDKKYCMDCKHWERFEPREGIEQFAGKCKHLENNFGNSLHNISFESIDGYTDVDVDFGMLFGCIHWEKK